MSTERYVSLGKARELLGVSKPKLRRMIKGGVLEVIESPLDKRFKLVKREDVEKLKSYHPTA